MNNVYPTTEIAEILGVSEATIRSQKTRNAATLTEGVHWVKDGNATLWTEAGKAVLAVSIDTPEAKLLRHALSFPAPTVAALQRTPTQDATLTVATLQRTPELAVAADELAIETLRNALEQMVGDRIVALVSDRPRFAQLVEQWGYPIPKNWRAAA